MHKCPNCQHQVHANAKTSDPQNSNLLDVISATKNQVGRGVGRWTTKFKNDKEVHLVLSASSPKGRDLLIFTIKFMSPHWDLISVKSAIEPKDLY